MISDHWTSDSGKIWRMRSKGLRSAGCTVVSVGVVEISASPSDSNRAYGGRSRRIQEAQIEA